MRRVAFLLLFLIVLGAALLSSRQTDAHLRRAFAHELTRAALPAPPASSELVTDADVADLPEPVRRYLHFMNVVGRPRDSSFRMEVETRFRREPGPWATGRVLQYDSKLGVSRIFYMQLVLKGLPVTVRDTYLHGTGHMLAKAFDLITLAEGTGTELDVGELVTYLNDAILFAPSLLLGAATTWTAIDRAAFDVALTDGGRTVKARVFVDELGAPTTFRTTDRFFDAKDGRRVRTEWSTPIDGWQVVNGRRIPTRGQAVWSLPEGPFAYADMRFSADSVVFNVPP